MELRQTIRTGIRNIRRAWWEPGLMLALSALLVAAAWLWIPAPLVENPVQTELLYIQVDSGTHGMVRWKPPKPWWSGRRPGPLWTTWPPSIRKTPSARPIRPWRAGPICTSTFGRRTAIKWWRSRWAGGQRRGVSYPRDGGGLALGGAGAPAPGPGGVRSAQIHGALSGESL